MQNFISISKTVSKSKESSLILTLILNQTRPFSQSTSIPKKQLRVRDHGFDNYMEVEKKMRKVIKYQELILSHPNCMISSSRLESLACRLGFKRFEAASFLLKLPHVFEIFEHPVQRILYCRLTPKALNQISQEKEALLAQIPDAVTRLRKLLLLSNNGRLRLEHIRITRRELGLPDDFELSVILKYPEYFRLIDDIDTRSKYIEIVGRDSDLTVCAIERLREIEYRERGVDAESIRFSFIVNFPPGFKIRKYFKIAVWKWQRLPYWSPYEDVSGYDMRSLEAQKRMEKRAIATIHELLSLTVEKKITLERIARFRRAMDLPRKLKEFLLQHQGIFYISTRGSDGKLHTIFLRDAYKKGDLIEPNGLYLARRRLANLILMGSRGANVDGKLLDHRTDTRDRVPRNFQDVYVENNLGRFSDQNIVEQCGEVEGDSVADMNCESDYTDEDDGSEVADT